jgi:site-specific DNA recombinase
MELDIYLRVSRLGDEKQRSLEGQEADSRERVREAGAEVGQVHRDEGRSAWNPRVRRAGWDALMSRLETGAADGVVVFDLERFSRQPAEGERLLAAAGNGLRVLDSDAEYDLTSPSGRKAFRDHMAAAAYFSDRLSSRTKRGKRMKALAGEVDRRRSFGFEPDGITIREPEARIIRDHAKRLLLGETQDALIAELTANGTPSVRGGEWGHKNYRQIMTRPRNAGYIIYDGKIVEGVRLPSAILDEATYRRIVALYAARRRGRQPSGRYTLTGIAVCGLCDSGLAGRPVSGTSRRHYWCKSCRRIFIDVRRLDEWAGGWAIRTLSDPSHADAISRRERELSEARSALEAEAVSIEMTATEIAARLGRGEISLARYDAVTGPLDARLAAVAAELAGLAPPSPVPLPARTIPERDRSHVGWLIEWEEGNRRAMVLRALAGRRIVVGPGHPSRFDSSRVSVRLFIPFRQVPVRSYLNAGTRPGTEPNRTGT